MYVEVEDVICPIMQKLCWGKKCALSVEVIYHDEFIWTCGLAPGGSLPLMRLHVVDTAGYETGDADD